MAVGLNRIGRRALVAVLLGSVAYVVVRLLGGPGALVRTAPRPSTGLQDLGDMQDLRTRFNQETGRARLILLVSPT